MTLCDSCNGACCRWVITEERALRSQNAMLLMLRGGRWELGRIFLPIPCRRLMPNGRCSQYERRLDQCRAFKPDCAECHACRRLEGVE